MSRPLQPRNRPDPQTPEEWQQAVDLAAGARAIADCRMYGLITGGPVIDVARCDVILRRGAKLGVKPSRPAVDAAIDLILDHNSKAGAPSNGNLEETRKN